MFIILRGMPDKLACNVFMGIHVPLYLAALFALSGGGSAEYVLKITIDIFLLLHAALHLAFRKHVHNGFGSLFSKAVIYAPSALALLHLILLITV